MKVPKKPCSHMDAYLPSHARNCAEQVEGNDIPHRRDTPPPAQEGSVEEALRCATAYPGSLASVEHLSALASEVLSLRYKLGSAEGERDSRAADYDRRNKEAFALEELLSREVELRDFEIGAATRELQQVLSREQAGRLEAERCLAAREVQLQQAWALKDGEKAAREKSETLYRELVEQNAERIDLMDAARSELAQEAAKRDKLIDAFNRQEARLTRAEAELSDERHAVQAVREHSRGRIERLEARLARALAVIEAAKKSRAGGPYTPLFDELDRYAAHREGDEGKL